VFICRQQIGYNWGLSHCCNTVTIVEFGLCSTIDWGDFEQRGGFEHILEKCVIQYTLVPETFKATHCSKSHQFTVPRIVSVLVRCSN